MFSLDIKMPRIGRHEFLEGLSNLKAGSIVVLMLTSSDKKIDKQKSLQYSFVKRYAEKPVVLDFLKELSLA
jgi:CheY-like chemotaxis protein